jgi:hypothetical protein
MSSSSTTPAATTDGDDDECVTSEDQSLGGFLPPAHYTRRRDEALANMPTLNETQSTALQELRAIADEIIASRGWTDDAIKCAWLDEACLRRFLRARNWSVNDAASLLRDACVWRDERKVWTMRDDRRDVLSFEIRSGKMYRHGFDRANRPIIYSRDRRQNSKDYTNQVDSVINCLERAAETMDLSRGVEQWVFMFDFAGYSMANAPPLHVSREVLDVFMNRYPERLGHAIMLDAPWMWMITFKAISPFLPSETKAKIRFVNGNAASKREQLVDLFDPATLEHMFGGDSKTRYIHNPYWQRETEEYDKYQSIFKPSTKVSEETAKSSSSGKKKKIRKKKSSAATSEKQEEVEIDDANSE